MSTDSDIINFDHNIMNSFKDDIFKNIIENSQIAIFLYSKNIIYANQALLEQSGYTQEELCSTNIWEFADKSCKDEVKKIVLSRYKGNLLKKNSHDFQFITKNGTLKNVRTTVEMMLYNGENIGVGTIVDISEFTQTKHRLQFLAEAVEKTADMVKIIDKDGKIIFVNDSTIHQLGYSRNELIGQNPSLFKSGHHDNDFYSTVWFTILCGDVFQGTFVNKKKNGHLFYEQETITPIFDNENRILKHFAVISKDISERIEMEQKLYELATVDTLTGIYNRQKCSEHLDIEISKFKRYNDRFVLIMLDIDDFKHVNDTYGHDVGDAVLIDVTRVISQQIRKSDIFSRWGGEEFMIIAPDLTLEEGIQFSEKLREDIKSYNFKKVGQITVSIGITLPKKGETKDKLLKRVDDAMYISKENGKDQTRIL